MITLGKSADKYGQGIGFDLSVLIDSRLLIQANSGGGKSWAIRRILEQSHGQVQQIVIDLEGEFSSLREKYDYIICGHAGDTSAEPRIAGHLAKRLLEIGVSAIIDLYELKSHERVRFVRLFLESIMSAPKKFWKPTMIVIDEAHHFCPEKGQAESAQAVIDLCTRGRKRGYCAVLATQRLSKLHKDACAELTNKLIGRTSLDIDQARAGDELGIISKVERLKLRDMRPGEFKTYGPALTDGRKCLTGIVTLIVGSVKSEHPKIGTRYIVAPPAPTSRIKKVLSQLADLPAEAEQEAKTVEEFRRKNNELKREIKKLESEKGAENQTKQLETEISQLQSQVNQLEQYEGIVLESHARLETIQTDLAGLMSDIELKKVPQKKEIARKHFEPARMKDIQLRPALERKAGSIHSETGEIKLRKGALRMATTLASRYPLETTKPQLATLSHLKSKSGTFSAYMSDLRRFGLIVENGKGITLSELGVDQYCVGDMAVAQTLEEIREGWRSKLRAGARRMFDLLIERYPETLSKQELAEQAGLEFGSGTYSAYLSDLRRNRLLIQSGSEVVANQELF